MHSKVKILSFALVASCLCVIVSLALVETALRLSGYEPWVMPARVAHDPMVYEPDAALGWRNKEGMFVLPPYQSAGKPIRLTFLPGGLRVTEEGRSGDGTRPKLICLGGSYTQGWAVSDDETFAWKLQSKLPARKVLNYGTSAYGTYQSLLVLERLLPTLDSSAIILYGFTHFHEERNVASSDWLETLARYSRRGHVFVPFASLNREGLCRNAPESYPAWPLREHLVTVRLAEKAFMNVKAKRRTAQKTIVTEELILEMNRLCKERSVGFAVVLLHCYEDVKDHYLAFLKKNHVEVIDCSFAFLPGMTVPGEGHPNEKPHSLWAE
jgi:hypothetical protein